MVNKQIVNWIKKNKSKGYSDDDLKEVLMKQGHSESDINEAISSLPENSVDLPPILEYKKKPEGETPKEEESDETNNKPKKKMWWIIGSIAAVLLIIIAALALTPSPSTDTTTPPNNNNQPTPTIPEPPKDIVIENYASTSVINLTSTWTQDGKKTNSSDIISTDTSIDLKNSAIHTTGTMASPLSPGQNIPLDMYMVGCTIYTHMVMEGIDTWTKMTAPNCSGALKTQIASSDPNAAADQLRNSLKDPAFASAFNITVVSEDPFHIKMVSTGLKTEANSMFESAFSAISSNPKIVELEKKTGKKITAGMNINKLDIEMWLNELSMPAKMEMTMGAVYSYHGPAADKCLRNNSKEECIEWSYKNTSIIINMKMIIKSDWKGYNEQPPIVVPDAAKNAGGMLSLMSNVSGDSQADLTAGLKDRLGDSGLSSSQIDDILAMMK